MARPVFSGQGRGQWQARQLGWGHSVSFFLPAGRGQWQLGLESLRCTEGAMPPALGREAAEFALKAAQRSPPQLFQAENKKKRKEKPLFLSKDGTAREANSTLCRAAIRTWAGSF